MENMFQKANLFNQCLSSWASKTQTVKTNFMFSSTKCPNLNSTPDENQGPWCQSATQGCDIPLGVIPLEPSNSPSSSQIPSDVPSIDPSVSPSSLPSSSQIPSDVPSTGPSDSPSSLPSTSQEPSAVPSDTSCFDDEDFRFTIQKKNGMTINRGGCSSYVAQKPSKRCKKKINGRLVRDKCPETCSAPKCTCIDQKKSNVRC